MVLLLFGLRMDLNKWGGLVVDGWMERRLKEDRASVRMEEDGFIYCIVITIDGKPKIIWE